MQAAIELAKKVDANEPGNSLYKLCKSADGGYFFIELYEGAEAMAQHRAAAHMKEAGPRFLALLGGQPEVTSLDVLDE